MTNREFARYVVDRALKLGAEAAEVAVVRSNKTEISVVNLTPETVNVQDELGFGVRVLKDSRMGFAASNRLDLRSAESTLDALVSVIREHTPDDANTLPVSPLSGQWKDTLATYDEEIKRTPLQEKVARAISLERASRDFDPRIKGSSFVVYEDGAEETTLISSRGVDGISRSTYAVGGIEAIADDSRSVETGSEVRASLTYQGLDTGALASTAAKRALRMLGSKPAVSAELPLIVPPEVGADILAYLSRMMDADAVQKGKSLFRGREHTTVASPIVSIVDDGRLPGGFATRFADAEGTPSQRTELVVDGVLRGFLYDAYAARKGSVASTSNAQRGGYTSRPHIGTTNFILKPGDTPATALISDVSTGLFITETQGLHAAINPVSGDFSIPGKGLMVRGGELAEPVTGLAISGNLFDLLKEIDAVSNELAWVFTGAIVGVPTFRVSNVKIGSSG